MSWILLFLIVLMVFGGYSVLFGALCLGGLGIFMVLEWWFLIMMIFLVSGGSTMERGGAGVYFVVMNFCFAFVFVGGMSWSMMSLVIALVILSKLPLFGLHSWLLNVHVEANVFTSMILASLVLNVGSLFVYSIGSYIVIFILFIVAVYVVLSLVDSKVIVGMSSVIHMSCCLMVSLVWYSGFSHVVVSPIMFYSVYLGYAFFGNRGSWVIGVLLVFMNIGFPLMGAFYGEIWLASVCVMMSVGYFGCFLFSYNLITDGFESSWIVIIILFLCLV